MADRKTWAIILGTTAGVAAAAAGIAWYAKSHGERDLRSVQEKIKWAHEKLEELERVADALKKPLSAA